MTQPACYLHPETPAAETCPGCLRPICGVCVVIYGLRTLCPACVARARRGRRLRLLIVVSALVLLAGGGLFALRKTIAAALHPAPKPPPAQPFAYGQFAPAVRELGEQLAAEPCDQPKIHRLTTILYRAGDYRSVITRTDDFLRRCGKYNRLLWTAYEAHMRLSEWQAAADVAGRLIADDPHDKDFRWWRGMAYEQKGELGKAAEDYRQSINLEPRLRSIPFNLATVLEKLGRHCEAILPLEQFLLFNPDVDNRDQIQARIDGLYARPDCSTLSGHGKLVLRRSRGHNAFVVRVSLNGRQPGKFIVDTGASYVSFSRQFAAASGVSLAGGQQVLLGTVSGVQRGTLVTVDEVRVGEAVALRVPAVAIEQMVAVKGLGMEIDGLLGLSFLSRFQVELGGGGETLTIAARP